MEQFFKCWDVFHSLLQKSRIGYLEVMRIEYPDLYQYIPKKIAFAHLMREVIGQKIEQGWNRQQIEDAYDLCPELALFLYDNILLENTVQVQSPINPTYRYEDFTLDEPEGDKIVWRPPQKEAIDKVLEQDFRNGLICHTVGVGKTNTALHLVHQFHAQNPEAHILFITERVSIMQDMFTKDGRPDIEKFQDWYNKGIIKMDEFTVADMVNREGRRHCIEKLNQQYDKPKFMIANRAFLTQKNAEVPKYRQINDKPSLIIYDEVHGIMANEAFKFMIDWGLGNHAKILGFSATPIREGNAKSIDFSGIQGIDVNSLNVSTFTDRLKILFHKQNNDELLNIYSICTAREAIQLGILVPPVFHWVNVQRTDDNGDMFTQEEKMQVMKIIDNICATSPYKKIIGWGRIKQNTRNWQEFWEQKKRYFNNLSGLTSYIQSSDFSNKDGYREYYESTSGIMFCPMMHREGSDIPKLSIAAFLDKTMNRGDIPTIQSIGRVLRTDPEGFKTNAHIIDTIVVADDEQKARFLADRMLGYYMNLVDIANNTKGSGNSKVQQYLQLMNSITFNPRTSSISFAISDSQNIQIHLDQFDLTKLEWSQIESHFAQLFQEQLEFDRQDEFNLLKTQVQQHNFRYPDEYRNNCVRLGFPETPENEFATLWGGWSDFLGINENELEFEDWLRLLMENNITTPEAYEQKREELCLPINPVELYGEITSLASVLRRVQPIFLHH